MNYKLLIETLTTYQKKLVNKYPKSQNLEELSDHIWNSDHPDIRKIDEDTISIPYHPGKITLNTHPMVIDYLKSKGHRIDDSDHTYAYVKHPNRESFSRVRTGKLLSERKDLQDLHRDTLNSATRNYSDHEIIIKRPKTAIGRYDVAGMSTDKNWTSCMRMPDGGVDSGGSKSCILPKDIELGTHVAYLVKKGTTKPNTELENKNVVARIAIKKFVSSDGHNVLVPDREYPSKSTDSPFHDSVSRFFDSHGGYKKNVLYHLHSELYDDGKHNHMSIDPDTAHNLDRDTLSAVIDKTKDPEVLHKLSKHHDPEIRYAITRNSYTHHKTLHELRNDPIDYIRTSVAYHENTHPDTLHDMSHHKDDDVRYVVANNKNTRSDTLHDMRHDKHKDVRIAIARNINSHPDTLHDMRHDENDLVIRWIANNKNTNGDTLHELRNHTNPAIRYAIVSNENVRKDTLEHMKKSETEQNTLDRINHKLSRM